MKNIKLERKNRRQTRVRSKIHGTASRPRLSVFRSLTSISAQLIDDNAGKTIASASDKEIKGKATKTEKAAQVGKMIASKAAEKKITEVIFDRGSYQYHGRIKAVADGAREGGLKF